MERWCLKKSVKAAVLQSEPAWSRKQVFSRLDHEQSQLKLIAIKTGNSLKKKHTKVRTVSPRGVLNQDPSCYKLARNVGCYLHFCTYLNAINWGELWGWVTGHFGGQTRFFLFRMHICINKCTSSPLQVTEHLFKGVICRGIPRGRRVSAWSVARSASTAVSTSLKSDRLKRFAGYNTRLYLPKQGFFAD